MASRLPAESDRAVDAPERFARPQTTGAPTPAVDATPRSTPTGTGKCAPVRGPRCDGESVESTDLFLSKCGKPVPLCANIAETLLVPLITEQGGKEIQHEEHEDILSGPGRRAKR